MEMSVKRLMLRNYRGIGSLSVEFAPVGTTVLVGKNGAGKSRVLDAIGTLLSFFVARVVPKAKPRGLEPDDVSNGKHEARIALTVSVPGSPSEAQWAIGLSLTPGQIAPGEFGDLDAIMRGFGSDWERNPEISFPVVVQYHVNRADLDIPARIRKKHEFDQFAAYDGALDRAQSNFR